MKYISTYVLKGKTVVFEEYYMCFGHYARLMGPVVRMLLVICQYLLVLLVHYLLMVKTTWFPWQQLKAAWLLVPTEDAGPLV